MKRLLLIVLMLPLLLVSCLDENKKIYESKGFTDMQKRLKPLIIKTGYTLLSLYSVPEPDTMAAVMGPDFSYIHFDKSGHIASVTSIVPGFPGDFGKYYGVDSGCFWMIRGRGVYTLDLQTGKTTHCIISHNPNVKLVDALVVDPVNRILLVKYYELIFPDEGPSQYVLISLDTGEIIFTSKEYEGFFIPMGNPDRLLYCQFYQKNDIWLFKWYETDLYMTKLKGNKLTKKLNELQFYMWSHTHTFHREKRRMIGYIKNTDPTRFVSVHWDEDLEDVMVEPLILQQPKGNLSDGMEFSPDGNWLKTELRPPAGLLKPMELIIYHVGDIYPQGISMPIYCGYKQERGSGAFLQHSVFGTCWLEVDDTLPGKYFLFKLNDGLTLLADGVL